MIDKLSSHIKNILHGFFLAVATTIAEPSTVLPLIVHHFSSSNILVGFFASLLRGGAILVQLFAAFHAQSYKLVMPYLKIVFLARFLSWFGIGLAILFFGENYPKLTLLSLAIGLFIFSFSAGFGAIYFKEILAKVFSHKFRGITMGYRQFFAGLGAILSGAATGWVLQNFEAPKSYAYLFMLSAILMGFGLLAFATIEEPVKENISKKEKSFKDFIKNAFLFLQIDKSLKYQIITILLSYSYLFAMPFVILHAKEQIGISGYFVGSLITIEMGGAMFSNILWGKLSSAGNNRLIITLSFIFLIFSFILAIIADEKIIYMIIFFLFGAASDGFRLAANNLILIIAPEEKRPVYVALQANITSIGLFFSIPGGIILKYLGYDFLYVLTIILLLIGLVFSFKLRE